jgi:hypothetical protein
VLESLEFLGLLLPGLIFALPTIIYGARFEDNQGERAEPHFATENLYERGLERQLQSPLRPSITVFFLYANA